MAATSNVSTAESTKEPKPQAGAPPAHGLPKELEGQVFSAEQIASVRSDANNYATTKSVTQVIFTTSAIASNVTLWNQLDRSSARFGALNALIWVSVALNIFVILLATYLSFQRPKPSQTEEADAVKGSAHAHAVVSKSPKQALAGDTVKTMSGPTDQTPAVADMPAGGHDPAKVHPGGKGGNTTSPQRGMACHCLGCLASAGQSVAPSTHDHDKAEKGDCCCWAGGTHREYDGDTVELCGVRLYSRINAHPSWACCDVGCCALFRVAGNGKGLGMLSVSQSKKRKRQFMDAKNNLVNEVIGILAVTIVIMNVIISSLAPSRR